jgi:heptosyltransferase I
MSRRGSATAGVRDLPDLPDLPPSPRVAIVMLTAVGDVVHTLPVVNSLRAALPGMHLTWVIQPGPHGLVADHPAVDEFIVFDRKNGWRAFRDLRRQVAGRRFDVVLDLQVYFKAGLITRLLPARRRIGFDRARARDLNWLFTNERIEARPRRHLQDELLEFVEHLGIEPRLEWGLDPTPEEVETYEPLLPRDATPNVGLVIGTSKPEKEWPAERYAALVDRLGARGVRSILIGAPSPRERAVAETIARLAATPPLDLLEWDLRRVVYLLSRVDALVSPDTGPLHIAVALGTPAVALMGYTNPRKVGPYGRFHDLLIDAYGEPGEDYAVDAGVRAGRMQRIGVDDVVDKIARALERQPRSASRGHDIH